MINKEDIVQYYPGIPHTQINLMYREYLQYLIIKYLYERAPGNDLILAGEYYNKILLGINRFSDSIDLIIDKTKKPNLVEINEIIRHALELEGYTVNINPKTGVYDGALVNYKLDVSIPDTQQIFMININYLKSIDVFKNKTQTVSEVNWLREYCFTGLLKSIEKEFALTYLVKKIVLIKKITPIELFDLYYFSQKYQIDKRFFTRSSINDFATIITRAVAKLNLNETKSLYRMNLIKKSLNKNDEFFKFNNWISELVAM